MNSVLIDTSMWIDFFSRHPKSSISQIESLKEVISNGEAVLIEPIRAELLSGHIASGLKREITHSLDSMDMIDIDWNSRTTWDDIVSLAEIAKSNSLRIPGIIDRMILIAALNANASIASLDKSLTGLAEKTNIRVWN